MLRPLGLGRGIRHDRILINAMNFWVIVLIMEINNKDKNYTHRCLSSPEWVSHFNSRFAPNSYSRDSDELTRWLESSQQTLNYWKEQSLNVSQDLDTIRSNIDRFFVSCLHYWSKINIMNKNIEVAAMIVLFVGKRSGMKARCVPRAICYCLMDSMVFM